MGCNSSKDMVTEINNGRLQENEFDIDLNDPEVQKAATKIQAGFRGLKVRKEMKDQAPRTAQEADDEIADIDLTDPELADAALKIQAGFRGAKVRKSNKAKKEEAELNEKLGNLNTDEEVDIDLSDPELNKAATKIQATFRGHRVRATDEH
ncbi:neuromodulin-like isoform X1 [Penaeus monodon]|uniref:neuromodulin-like isoform X1 n=1 Tax=Penaeus monodon TaxID=6687 RepID=UPI0018A77CD4|nr:neuromodulin-like isoform X1 [Penaeus monodon]